MDKKTPDWLPQAIVFEDSQLVAVNKPAGLPTQKDKSGDPALAELLQAYYGAKGEAVDVGLVHRLDRRAGGLALFAKTPDALRVLNAALQNRQVQKTYWAVCQNPPPHTEGTLGHWLLKNQAGNKSYVVDAGRKGAKKAVLQYRHLAESDRYHLLQVELHTGRHHQIRVQLGKVGCPIKGDLKYGAKRSNKNGSIHLHAIGLLLPHPATGEPLELYAKPPENDAIWSFFEKLHGK